MKVLVLSSVLPHAHVVSGHINVYHRIRLLAQRGHEIGLAAFMDEADRIHVPDLQKYLVDLETLPRPVPGLTPIPRWERLFNRMPPEFYNVYHPEMQKLVGNMVENGRYDVVVAEFTTMGQYLYRNPFLPAVRRVISCHSCQTSSLRKAIHMHPYSLSSLWHRWTLGRLQDYEFALYRNADLVLTLTAEERLDLLRYDPDLRVAVIPYGVDMEEFHPDPQGQPEESIVYTGYFAQEQNRDAFFWFTRTVWPTLKERHPGLKLYVVGRAPSREMQDVARSDPRIVVTGEVEDISAYLHRALIYVCPIRMGTGFRGKILQAMAAGVPVVSTTLAAEGIPVQNGQNMLLADTPHTMEAAVSLLLSDSTLRRFVAANACDLVARRFAWDSCVGRLDAVLKGIVKPAQRFAG